MFLVVKEMGVTFDYVLYEMEWFVFLECYNWCLMYSHGHKRTWVERGEVETGMMYKQVYDEANMNWIDYMPEEKHRYTWMPKQHCFWLRVGD